MYFILIRKQRETDTPQVSQLVRTGYCSNIRDMFMGALFHEATGQIAIILTAVLFIFFQVKLLYCTLCLPTVLLIVYIYIYITVLMKSAYVMYEKKPLVAWVAEAYEPFFNTRDPKECVYKVINEDELKQTPEGRKKIIGTIAVMKHSLQSDWAWLYRAVVDEKYRRKSVALNLVKAAQEWCKLNQYNRMECAMSEFNEGARQLFDKTGFEIKQLYHVNQFGRIYKLQMYLLSAQVRPTFN
ncbi:unnamed protein product [Ceutorhynchus assimilis]|uniref:N-acetyltransferase domain-containing protein n=1 Tax=Ceutorhynchus assimilis TaxID=467358 RepID=A0A9N9MEC5_9CUCU|nr:unnamed protein product [Ceutorhynchus assimilis]